MGQKIINPGFVPANSGGIKMEQKEVLKFLEEIDAKKDLLKECSDFLWENPETAFTEYKSVAYLTDLMEKQGFQVERNVANIETAFAARFGSGHPVIGLLGEYDALSGLSQVAGAAEKTPLEGVSCGQGCGHNYLGTAEVAAALAIKKYLEETKHEGTVIFYGCPAEEGGSGKAFMARDGVFDELDCAFAWHPASDTAEKEVTSLANYQVLYKFDGLASHAGGAPEKGRSALDAVELMNTGVQYLREHMADSSRIHYAITDAGGYSPNVVQAHAEVLYLIRAIDNPSVKELFARVNKIAEGAALMTETTMTYDFIKACSNTILNDTLTDIMGKWMEVIQPEEPSAEDVAFAKEIQKTLTAKNMDPDYPIHWKTIPKPNRTEGHGSTDVGDVSWVCPIGQLIGATWTYGTPAHSWQSTAQGKWDWGQKITRYIGKITAAAAIEIMENPAELERAKAEHRELVGPNGYEPPIPKDVKPRALNKL